MRVLLFFLLPLTLWARRPASLAALAARGDAVADSPAALAAGSDCVLTCLPRPARRRQVRTSLNWRRKKCWTAVSSP